MRQIISPHGDSIPGMNATRPKARVYHMRANVPRVVEAILHLVAQATDRGVSVTQYDIVKSLFLADKAHLNKYGRPITFDNYVAMKHGPVPSLAYDVLKENASGRAALRQLQMANPPWRRRDAPEIGDGCFSYEQPLRQSSDDILSSTDFEELETALTIVKALQFRQIRKLTHEDQAYIDAWEDDGAHYQYPMSYALLFDYPNEEKAEELSFLSKHL
jgi:uncharacterized phage-associated protein